MLKLFIIIKSVGSNMNKSLLNSINKSLYDIDSTLETVKDSFIEYDINIDIFLEVIKFYIENFSTLESTKEENLVGLLDEKLKYILSHYHYIDDYSTQIKANINFIEKHKETFFQDISFVKDLPYIISDSLGILKTISVENFYSIKNISLSKLGNKKEIYIVGENGDGKTLLLQAIAISLVGISQGKVFDLVNKERDFSFLAENIDGVVFQSNAMQGMIYNHFIAYGASRNNFCQIKEDDSGYLTLFGNEYDLKSPIKWLTGLYNAQNANAKVIISLDEAIRLLQKLLNRDITIDVSYDKVIFKERGSEVSFEQLSAGYRGVITIICDMIERFSKKQDVNNIKDFKGIVLIDEVELHLHPKWQYSFMNKLRNIFPHIQFIVTTHSATVLLGASKEAVYYQIYKKDGVVQISEQKEMKNDFLNDIQSTVFGFDVNEERINNPTNDDKSRQERAKKALLNLIDTIGEEKQ